MGTSTTITTAFDKDAQDLMTGEMYPIYSNDNKPILTEMQAKDLLKIFHLNKFNRYYDCIRKAKLTAKFFQVTAIRLGSLMLESTEKGVQYGYEYHPPLELHAWVQIEDNIIDLALPGTIEKGLQTKDDVGYFLVNRKPIILAGVPATWLHYETHEIISVKDVNILDTKSTKELFNKTIWKYQ